jgi:hypothetical protein
MKQLTIWSFALLILIGCKNKTEDPSEEPPTKVEGEDYYNCSDFFLSGDYTSFCTIKTEKVVLSKSTIDGGGTVCGVVIPASYPEPEVGTAVQFLSLETTAQAASFFQSRKESATTAATDDPKKFYSDITIEGYGGFISEGQFANYSKSISIQYKNVLVTTSVVYYKEWLSTEPCNYTTNELTKLMTAVLKNM